MPNLNQQGNYRNLTFSEATHDYASCASRFPARVEPGSAPRG